MSSSSNLCVELIRLLSSAELVYMQVSWMNYEKIAAANKRLEHAGPMWDDEYLRAPNMRLALYVQQLNALHDALLASLSKGVHAGNLMHPLATLLLDASSAQACGPFMFNADSVVTNVQNQIAVVDAFAQAHLLSAAHSLRAGDVEGYDERIRDVARLEEQIEQMAELAESAMKGFRGRLGSYDLDEQAFRYYSTIPDELLDACPHHLVMPLMVSNEHAMHMVSVVISPSARTIELFDSNGFAPVLVAGEDWRRAYNTRNVMRIVVDWASLSGMLERGYSVVPAPDDEDVCVAMQRDIGETCTAWTTLMATLRLLCPAEWSNLSADGVVRKVLAIAIGSAPAEVTTENTFEVRQRLVENWIALVWQVRELRLDHAQFYMHSGRDAPKELPRKWGTRRVMLGGRIPVWVRAPDPTPPETPISPLEAAAVDYLECRGWRYFE